MAPKVSVILPVYNVAKYLEQCLDSICNQTLKEIEIICVDDGSADQSLEILRAYAKKDPRIVIVTQQNMGAGAARNTGLKIAQGKYLSFLDSDDFFEADMLEVAVHEAEKYQADFVVFGSDQYHNEKKCFVETEWTIKRSDIPPYMPFTYRELSDNIFFTFVGWAWDKLYLREFIQAKELTFQEQRTTNDLYFVFSALVLADRIAIVKKRLAHQRIGLSTSLSATREKSWECFYQALLALRKCLFLSGTYKELERDFINYSIEFGLWQLDTLSNSVRNLLAKKMFTEWFVELGISSKSSQYFYKKEIYEKYLKYKKQEI